MISKEVWRKRMVVDPNKIIGSILKHDRKQNTYKFALLRAINDVALSFPDMHNSGRDVVIPLRVLAEFWLAYYWPFVDPTRPIMQGARSVRGGTLRADMAFRAKLTAFREIWQEAWGGSAHSPADGFFLIEDMRVQRNRGNYDNNVLKAYHQALKAITNTIAMPIRYAGPGEWSVFEKPQRLNQLDNVAAVPGTMPNDVCLVIKADLWLGFHALSVWIEALCIHEWCLFTEGVEQPSGNGVDRGIVYAMLTVRPDNRRPLTWERNYVDLLLRDGHEFTCPWTEKRIRQNVPYDLDHLVPVSVYPINELWNLVPSDPDFNSHKKRDRLPSQERRYRARPHLVLTYSNYGQSQSLSQALQDDVAGRFTTVSRHDFPASVAGAVVDFIAFVAESRNLPQF
jgi:hypothetical protein